MVGAAPVIRMIRALAIMGYGLEEVARETGISRVNLAEVRRGERQYVRFETARQIVAMYRKRWNRVSRHPQAQMIATRARSSGFHSPMHWHDIEKGTTEDDEY